MDTPTSNIYTLSLHDALPISAGRAVHGVEEPIFDLRHGWRPVVAYERHPRRIGLGGIGEVFDDLGKRLRRRSEEHTSELQSQSNLVCRLLLEKKKKSREFTNI